QLGTTVSPAELQLPVVLVFPAQGEAGAEEDARGLTVRLPEATREHGHGGRPVADALCAQAQGHAAGIEHGGGLPNGVPDLFLAGGVTKPLGIRTQGHAKGTVSAALIREKMVHVEPDVAEAPQEEEDRGRQRHDETRRDALALGVGDDEGHAGHQDTYAVEDQNRLPVGEPEAEEAMVNVLLVG